MTLPEVSIRRPVMTTLIMGAILHFGIVAYRQLPVSDLPNVDFPTVVVSASLPGSSPETMASSVATPLERQFSTIAGIDSMTSNSVTGQSTITLQFSLDRTLDAAAQDVQAAISIVQPRLPPEMPTPPSFRKVNPADQPILYLAIVSPTLPLSVVDEYAETTIAQRISMVNGVAQVLVFGSQKYAVRAKLDPGKLAMHQIGIDEVQRALASGNVNLPTGTLDGRHSAFTIEASGQLGDAAGFRRLIVAWRNGSPVRLEQLGDIVDSVQNDRVASWFRDTRAIVLAVQRQPGTNTVAVVDAVKELLPKFRGQLPASVSIETINDRSQGIRRSVADVKFTLVLAICLVVCVIFLFLRTLSGTLIPSAAMPMSIVGTFAVMYLLGHSVDNLSLMALTLSVGFVVDDAIVVLENIVRHIENGEPVMDAALRGSREIGFTVISMTLSLAAVFLPVLFMGGVLGRLLHEFSIVIGVAILVSGFVSLTLTPMLCSRFLRAHKHGELPSARTGARARLYAATERAFDAMRDAYRWSLDIALRRRRTVLVIGLALVAGTAWLFRVLPTGFIPDEDTGTIFAFTEAAQGISFEEMARHQQAVAAVVLRNPHVKSFMSSIGAGGPSQTGNTGRMFMQLKPRSERPPAQKIIEELRPQFAAVPGIRVFPQIPPLVRIGGQLTKSVYQFTLYGADIKELYRAAPAMEEKMRALPGLQDVTSDLQITSPQVNVDIDRDKASALGVTAEQIENALYSAYGSRQVSTIYTPTNQYWVIMEVADEFQRDPASLAQLYVRASTGRLVPLSAVAAISTGVGPLNVAHLGQLPAVTISFNLKEGTSLGEAVPVIEELARRELPATVSTGFQGSAQAFQTSLKGLGLLLAIAILVIYIVLGILYESFIHPLTILSGLPAASFGALLTLLIFGAELNLYGFVGLLMLIGIVKKNAIMMIDFALEAQRREKLPASEAIYQACLIRFRPIMMTTLAALMGTLPIALGIGAGAESRRPLGLAVVGGLVVSQMLTLYLTPVIYLYLERFHEWVRRRGWYRKRATA